MELTKNQFDILVELTKGDKSQRELTKITGRSLGTVNTVIRELTGLGLVQEKSITQKGLNALEKYRVKRAIFIAAGFGSRLVPVTLKTPKPLVEVKGKRIIDGLIDACIKADITEIYIVRGYLAHKFNVLKEKYPEIKFIENPVYNEANNIASALCANSLLENAYVFEADLFITNPDIIYKYHYTSDFLAIKKAKTDDWCFSVDNKNVITEEKIGGINTWQMVGISYWNKADGARLATDIPAAYYSPGGKEYYWEQVPLKLYKDHYKVQVRECFAEDIVEIDTFNELKAIDKSYENYKEEE